MSLDSHLLSTASQSLRGYAIDGTQEGRDQARRALSDLVVSATADDDEWARTRLRRALDLLELGSAYADQADLLVDEVSMRR